MKWNARVNIDGEGTRTITVEAETAKEADDIFYSWFCNTYKNSDGVMYKDYCLYSEWMPLPEPYKEVEDHDQN